MSEALKAVVWRLLEDIWHQGNLQVIDEIIAPNYVRHTSHFREGGRDVHGPEGVRQSVAAFRAAFPDVHFTVEDMVADSSVRVSTRLWPSFAETFSM